MRNALHFASMPSMAESKGAARVFISSTEKEASASTPPAAGSAEGPRGAVSLEPGPLLV